MLFYEVWSLSKAVDVASGVEAPLIRWGFLCFFFSLFIYRLRLMGFYISCTRMVLISNTVTYNTTGYLRFTRVAVMVLNY